MSSCGACRLDCYLGSLDSDKIIEARLVRRIISFSCWTCIREARRGGLQCCRYSRMLVHDGDAVSRSFGMPMHQTRRKLRQRQLCTLQGREGGPSPKATPPSTPHHPCVDLTLRSHRESPQPRIRQQLSGRFGFTSSRPLLRRHNESLPCLSSARYTLAWPTLDWT